MHLQSGYKNPQKTLHISFCGYRVKMSKSNRLTASLEVPSRSPRVSPIGSPVSSRYAGSYGPNAKYRTPDPVADPPPTPPLESQQEAAATKAELTRMKAKESVLMQMLDREKEYRVKADQLVEVEKIACLELKLQLHREKKRSGEEEIGKISLSFEDEEDVSLQFYCVLRVVCMN